MEVAKTRKTNDLTFVLAKESIIHLESKDLPSSENPEIILTSTSSEGTSSVFTPIQATGLPFDLMARFKRDLKNRLRKECTQEKIVKKYTELESKEMHFDPEIYNITATDISSIHRRLLAMFGSDVIRLKDRNFTEECLQVMLEKEEEAEKEKILARRIRGKLIEWKSQLTSTERKKQLKKGKKMSPSVTTAKTYDLDKHNFEIPVHEHHIDDYIWDEDKKDSLRADKVEFMFKHAHYIVSAFMLPEQVFELQRRNRELSRPTTDNEKQLNTTNNNETKKDTKSTQKVAFEDFDEDDTSLNVPLALNLEEKKIEKFLLDP